MPHSLEELDKMIANRFSDEAIAEAEAEDQKRFEERRKAEAKVAEEAEAEDVKTVFAAVQLLIQQVEDYAYVLKTRKYSPEEKARMMERVSIIGKTADDLMLVGQRLKKKLAKEGLFDPIPIELD